MHILLVAATPFEIQPAIDGLLKSGGQPGHTIATLITGIGSMATTWSLMRQIDRTRPDLIIQAGIAGCFSRRPLGQVVVISEEVQADLGVWEEGQFKSLFDLNLAGAHQFPFSNGRLVNPHRQLLALTSLEAVRAMTVNEITTDPGRILWHQQNTAAVVESMEGAGLHWVGLQENIPFLQLRAISNEIGVRDKAKWDIRLAIGRLNEQLSSLLEKLAGKDEALF
jgi:futalosine hydrolase